MGGYTCTVCVWVFVTGGILPLQVATLVSLHFLSLMSAGDNLDAPRYKVCMICMYICMCAPEWLVHYNTLNHMMTCSLYLYMYALVLCTPEWLWLCVVFVAVCVCSTSPFNNKQQILIC